MVRTAVAIRARTYRAAGFNFSAIALGFVFQTAFISLRGHALGRCPLTNLFEVFIFIAWSVSLIYLLIGPAVSAVANGRFHRAAGFCFANIRASRADRSCARPDDRSLALAGNTRLGLAHRLWRLRARLRRGPDVSCPGAPTQDTASSIRMFYHFPPLTDLFAAITRLLWLGFVLLTLGNCGRVSHRPAAALRQDRLVVRGVGFLCRHSARAASRDDRPAPDRRALCRRL